MDRPMIPIEEYAQRRAAGGDAGRECGLRCAGRQRPRSRTPRWCATSAPTGPSSRWVAWPSPPGQSALMVGMESGEFAKERSVIDNIHLLKEYRETADPVYPGVAGSRLHEVFESIGVTDVKRIGVAGYLCTNMAMYEGLRKPIPHGRDRQRRRAHGRRCGPQVGRRAGLPARGVPPRRAGARGHARGRQAGHDRAGAGRSWPSARSTPTALRAKPTRSTRSVARRPPTASRAARTAASRRATSSRSNVGGRVDGYSPSVGRPICLGR